MTEEQASRMIGLLEEVESHMGWVRTAAKTGFLVLICLILIVVPVTAIVIAAIN